jgi:hypothetical protein
MEENQLIMGILSYLFAKLIYPFLFTGGATWTAFRLGAELPVASRMAGRSMGMGYNYFKLMVKFVTPESEQANRVISSFRKGSQQAHAFTRELKHHMNKSSRELREKLPELDFDPLSGLDPHELSEQKALREKEDDLRKPIEQMHGSDMM